MLTAEPARQSSDGDSGDSQESDLARPVEELNLSLRAYNSLRREGIHTVGDLAAKTREDLLAIDHIGPASVEEIRQKLADRGLTLSDSPATGNGVPAAPDQAATAPDKAAAAPGGHPATVPSRISTAAPPASATAAAGPDGAGRAGSASATASHGVTRDNAGPSDDDAIDLLSVAGLPVLKRAAPVAAAIAAVAVIAVRLRIKRRRSRG
jgi:hypothetical protein